MASPELPRDWEMLTMLMRRLGTLEPGERHRCESGPRGANPGAGACQEARGRAYTTRRAISKADKRREERKSRWLGLSRPPGAAHRCRCASGPHRVEDRAGQCGIDVVHPRQLVAGEASAERQGGDVDQILGTGSKDVDAEQAAARLVEDCLDQAVGLLADACGRRVDEGRPTDRDRGPPLSCGLLGEADL